MRQTHRARERELLVEAFRAGWQAALAVPITNPRVMAVVDSCFELWLEEMADEVLVLGLPFRGRADLPGSSGVHRDHPATPAAPAAPKAQPEPHAVPEPSPAAPASVPVAAAAFTGLATGLTQPTS